MGVPMFREVFPRVVPPGSRDVCSPRIPCAHPLAFPCAWRTSITTPATSTSSCTDLPERISTALSTARSLLPLFRTEITASCPSHVPRGGRHPSGGLALSVSCCLTVGGQSGYGGTTAGSLRGICG
jgi:hypothetical protein